MSSQPRIGASQINELILDLFVVNGYRDVAEQFVEETGLDQVDLVDIGKRKQFKKLLLEGRVQEAIKELNELDSWFLDSHFRYHYQLLELQLIELIRAADLDKDIKGVNAPLEFAEHRILALIKQQPVGVQGEYIRKLQMVLALVCFPVKSLPLKLQSLLSIERRAQVADEMNKALLEWRGLAGTGKLWRVIKLYKWAEKKLHGEELENAH